MIERAVNEIKVKLSNSNNDPLAEEHLTSQRILLERDLSSTVVQLAAASKVGCGRVERTVVVDGSAEFHRI